MNRVRDDGGGGTEPVSPLLESGIPLDGLLAAWNPADVRLGPEVLFNEVEENHLTVALQIPDARSAGVLWLQEFGTAYTDAPPVASSAKEITVFTAVEFNSTGSFPGTFFPFMINSSNVQFSINGSFIPGAYVRTTARIEGQNASQAIPKSTWSTLCLTFKSGVLQFYLNAVQAFSRATLAGDLQISPGRTEIKPANNWQLRQAPILVYDRFFAQTEVAVTHKAFRQYAIANDFYYKTLSEV